MGVIGAEADALESMREEGVAKASEAGDRGTGPLKGVRILDMTSVVFGAYATQMLGDLGADVIKVEFPGGRRGGGGDIMRWAGALPQGGPTDLGPIFLTINRNKRSVLLDLREEKAARSAAASDQDLRRLRRLGALRGPEAAGPGLRDVKAVRPDIIYCHGAGYGADGPYAGEPAYDDLIQSGSGLADLLPRADGNPVAALPADARRRQGRGAVHGQRHHGRAVPQASAPARASSSKCRCWSAWPASTSPRTCSATSSIRRPASGPTPARPTRNRKPFPTKDGYIGLLPYTDQQWDQFFEVAGWGETFEGPALRGLSAPAAAHISELYAMVDEVTRTRTTDEWLALLKPLQHPGGADEPASTTCWTIRTSRRSDLFQRHEHPGGGRLPRAPPAGAVSPPPPPTSAATRPGSGEHTDEVLAELGRRDAEGGVANAPAPDRLHRPSNRPDAAQLEAVFGLQVGYRDPGVGVLRAANIVIAGRRRVPRGGRAVPAPTPLAPATSRAAAGTPATW